MLISDSIAKLLDEMLSDNGGQLEIRRNDLALKLGCVPSQINYVITSRFTPEKGYVIESRRGGGGYIRIIKKQMHKDSYLMHFYHSIGNELDTGTADAMLGALESNGFISEREKDLLHYATLPASDTVRADMMRQIILAVMR